MLKNLWLSQNNVHQRYVFRNLSDVYDNTLCEYNYQLKHQINFAKNLILND